MESSKRTNMFVVWKVHRFLCEKMESCEQQESWKIPCFRSIMCIFIYTFHQVTSNVWDFSQSFISLPRHQDGSRFCIDIANTEGTDGLLQCLFFLFCFHVSNNTKEVMRYDWVFLHSLKEDHVSELIPCMNEFVMCGTRVPNYFAISYHLRTP